VDEAGDGAVRVFGERVRHHALEAVQLRRRWDDLPPDRAGRVVGVDQAGKIGRNVQPEAVARGNAHDFIRREMDQLGEFFEGVEAVRELPAPVVPIAIRHAGPERGAGRNVSRATRGRLVGGFG